MWLQTSLHFKSLFRFLLFLVICRDLRSPRLAELHGSEREAILAYCQAFVLLSKELIGYRLYGRNFYARTWYFCAAFRGSNILLCRLCAYMQTFAFIQGFEIYWRLPSLPLSRSNVFLLTSDKFDRNVDRKWLQRYESSQHRVNIRILLRSVQVQAIAWHAKCYVSLSLQAFCKSKIIEEATFNSILRGYTLSTFHNGFVH